MNKKMAYSNSEYYEMIMCVGAENGNMSAARKLYRQRFIDGVPAAKARQLPSLACFRRVTHRLYETGSFHAPASEGRPSKLDPAFEESVLQLFEENPKISIRSAAEQLAAANHIQVWRIVKRKQAEQTKILRKRRKKSPDSNDKKDDVKNKKVSKKNKHVQQNDLEQPEAPKAKTTTNINAALFETHVDMGEGDDVSEGWEQSNADPLNDENLTIKEEIAANIDAVKMEFDVDVGGDDDSEGSEQTNDDILNDKNVTIKEENETVKEAKLEKMVKEEPKEEEKD